MADLILFVAEDELRGIDTLIKYIYHKDFASKRLKTYRNLTEELKYEFLDTYLNDIKQQGIHVLNLVVKEKVDYVSKMEKNIGDKFSALGEQVSGMMPPAMYPEFLDELYTEAYADHIMHLPFAVETGSYSGKLRDIRGEFYNVINGERYTEGQPEEYRKTIYFVGPCFIYGHYVEDKNTIESLLQKYLNDAQEKIRVVNCGSLYSRETDLALARIMEIPLKRVTVWLYT